MFPTYLIPSSVGHEDIIKHCGQDGSQTRLCQGRGFFLYPSVARIVAVSVGLLRRSKAGVAAG